VWKKFQQIRVDMVSVDFVICTNCHHVLTYKKSDGTKGMHAHRCSSDQPNTPLQTRMTSFTVQRTLPPTAYDNLKTQMVKYVACDLRPFSSVSGSGFQALCQTLVDYGAKYGPSDVSCELPQCTTLSRSVPDMVVKTKADLCSKLSSCNHTALTSDGWTDNFRKIAYVTVTAQYFDFQHSSQRT